MRTNHAENPLSHVRVEGLGLVLVTKMKPGRRWVLVAQLWYPGKKGQVHWYLHTMKESGNSEGKKYLDVIRRRFRLQKTTVTILSLHCLERVSCPTWVSAFQSLELGVCIAVSCQQPHASRHHQQTMAENNLSIIYKYVCVYIYKCMNI